MNEPSDTAGTPSDAQWRSLRNLVHCVAIAVLVLTVTVGVFLFRQVVIVRKNTMEMAVFLKRYEDSDFPEAIERVRQRLDEYRQKDPGFNPIYIRYFGSNPPARPFPAKTATNAAAEAAR